MSNSDYYIDDPANFQRPNSKKRFSGIFALIAALIGGTFYIQSTLAANISLNSGSGVEFGQGVTQTVACSGSDSITITPSAGFVNSSSAGTFKFSSIRVDDIPAGCQGSDFIFSAYDNNAGSAAQAIFNTTSTRAVVYIKSGGTFEIGIGGTGATVTTNFSTSFTVNFTSPVALSSDVAKITIESTAHTPVNCGDGGACVLGDTGPGGGFVFFDAGSQQSWGRYLEAAPEDTGLLVNWSGNTSEAITTSFDIGSGSANTLAMTTQDSTENKAGTLSKAYRGPNTLTDWYLPSKYELNVLCKYARGQVTANITDQCNSTGTLNNALNFTAGDTNYWSSSNHEPPAAWAQNFTNGSYDAAQKTATAKVRPIRAF